MKVATWNVNSIRAREERLLLWLGKEQPDIVCLQELKVTDEAFPHDAMREAGYYATVYGQRTYNGVAILSRTEPANVRYGMDDEVDDRQARLVSAEIEGVRIICAYVPNGRVVGSEHYVYKLEWMRRLRDFLVARAKPDDPLVLAGDFNVAPDDSDTANPELWRDSVLSHDSAREALTRIGSWGLTDVLRKFHPEGGVYSWWDYRMLAFPKGDGLRIDLIFATEPMARRCTESRIDRNQRKGKKPSDHAPVIAEFDR